MTRYLIEFRFFGKVKYKIKDLIWKIDKKYWLRRSRGFRPVPHITLVGPFYTKNQKKLVSDFLELCSKQPIMHFKIKGYGTFEDSRVIHINIEPDINLGEFRWKLSNKLKSYCNLTQYDLERKFHFHAAIAMKLHPDKFEKIKKYINKQQEPKYDHCLMRVTLIKNQRILREYDFFLKKLLTRREAKSRKMLSKTFRKLDEYLQESGTVDIISSIEEQNLGKIKEGLFKKIINKFRKRKIFFISDLHLDHTNIIKYCNRPFKSTNDMNNFIVENWNKTIGKSDIVYFLGDVAFGRGSRNTDYWVSRLNGNIIFIKGNHDRSKHIKFYEKLILNYNNQKFLLVHDPSDVPKDWQGWVIHGHKHNKPEYPIVNRKNKTIHVSVEVLSYKPILFEDLLKLIK